MCKGPVRSSAKGAAIFAATFVAPPERDGSVAYWIERLEKRQRSGEEGNLVAVHGRVR